MLVKLITASVDKCPLNWLYMYVDVNFMQVIFSTDRKAESIHTWLTILKLLVFCEFVCHPDYYAFKICHL